MSKPVPVSNDEGEVIAHDHPQLNGGHCVFRRVTEYHIHNNPDGTQRLNSIFYSPSSRGNRSMSVDLEQLLLEDQISPEDFFDKSGCLGVVSFPISAIRAVEFLVGYDPDDENVYHGGVWADLNKREFARRIQEYATWLLPIEGVCL